MRLNGRSSPKSISREFDRPKNAGPSPASPEFSEREKKRLLENFGKRVEFLIYESFPSKEAFLKKIGMHKANLHQIIRGNADPQLSTLFRLARGLEMKLPDLLDLEAKKRGPPMKNPEKVLWPLNLRVAPETGWDKPAAVSRLRQGAGA